jgi:hypothetical protein
MGSNIREFRMGLDRFKADIDVNVGKLHRAVALEGLKGVVRMTPVDTGRARANWQVTQDVPATGERDATDKGGGATLAAGGATIERAPAYSVTFIANNLPYIETLEDGGSTQAPNGMLNVTYQRLQNWLARMR